MDNLAHSLVGLAASKAGLEKLSPGATTVCILAANAPDVDFVSALSGDRWTVLHFHRGITHSIVGILLLAVIIPALLCLADLAIARLRSRPGRLRFFPLLAVSVIASATHPILDWTNNYGVRPLLPWSDKWFYGDLVFVVDPFLWLMFGSAAFLLTANSKWRVRLWALLGAATTLLVVYGGAIYGRRDHGPLVLALWIITIIALVICYRRGFGRRFGHKLAVASFVVLFAYWGGLSWLHSRALVRAGTEVASLAAKSGERVNRIVAMPTLANPTRWRCIVETDLADYRFDVFLVDPERDAADVVRVAKPGSDQSGLIDLAAHDRRALLFFEFARFPVARVVGADCRTQTLVQFADFRYTEPGKPRGNFSLDVAVPCSDQTIRTSDGRQ